MGFDFEHAVGLMVATAILGLSPGPAVFATIAHAIKLPLRRVYFFIAGIVVADFVFAMMAMLGVAVLVSQHEILFYALRAIGGGYLLYLGMKALVPYQAGGSKISTIHLKENQMGLFLGGFMLTAGNPKDLLFFVSFLPAFINLKEAGWAEMVVAALLIVVTFIATLSVYAVFAGLAKDLLKSEKISLWFDRVTGALLVIVGLMVLFVPPA